MKPQPQDFEDDFEFFSDSFENTCSICSIKFRGAKRRNVCQICEASIFYIKQDKSNSPNLTDDKWLTLKAWLIK